MSASRAVRVETFSTYRRLIRAAHDVTRDCPLYRTDGLSRYIADRFFDAAERNRRRYLTMRSQCFPAAPSLSSSSSSYMASSGSRRKLRALDAQFERFIGVELRRVGDVVSRLYVAPGNEALTAMLQVLAAGVGNRHYRRAVERDFLRYCEFEQRRAERDEVAEDATADRQNRVMQHALMAYGERLLLLYRMGPNSGELSAAQLSEKIIGTRSGASAHVVSHGREDVVVEVDETYNKQVVYVRCAPYDWAAPIERVDVAEPEELRGTVLHAEFLAIATRLCEALLSETPLHAYRSTVVVGHGVGGAVGLCLALLLHARGFHVANCITFGAPKSVQSVLQRYVHAVTPIRVVLEGDPLVELPVSGAEGDLFVHFGEILLMGGVNCSSEGEEERKGKDEEAVDDATPHVDAADTLAEMLAGSLDVAEHNAQEDKQEQHQNNKKEGDYNSNSDNSDDNIEEEEEETDWGTSAAARVAAERYEAAYQPAHYMARFTDTTTPLTYAEGDEVWDEGEYAQLRRDAPHPQPNSDTGPPL